MKPRREHARWRRNNARRERWRIGRRNEFNEWCVEQTHDVEEHLVVPHGQRPMLENGARPSTNMASSQTSSRTGSLWRQGRTDPKSGQRGRGGEMKQRQKTETSQTVQWEHPAHSPALAAKRKCSHFNKCNHNNRSSSRSYTEATMSWIRSVKKLMVEPSATVGLGIHSAAIHGVFPAVTYAALRHSSS